MKHLLLTVVFMSILLSACGPAATPTINPADIQGTAIAMAWTMAAETLAAIPTATPIPPTETPTATLPPTATLEFPATPGLFTQPTNTASSSGKKGICEVPLSSYTTLTAPIKIINELKTPLSLWVCVKTRKHEWGVLGSYSVPKAGTILHLPMGEYWVSAWVEGKGFKSGHFSFNNTDKWIMIIRETDIILKAP